MRQLVESLKRLFTSNMIDKTTILKMNKDGKLTDAETNYILSE